MRHDTSTALFEYWNTIRNGRPAPERSEIEPGEIRRILGDTFILEVSRKMRTIAFRLAGTRLCAAHGRELKGLGFLALWREEDNYQIAKAIHRVYDQFDPMILAYTAKSQSDRFVDFECLLLPLLPAADGNSRILGVATAKNPPFWLGSDPLEINHLRSARTIEIQSATPALASPLTQIVHGADGAMPKRRGHLVVFEGGRTAQIED